jgi:hypothetical protein
VDHSCLCTGTDVTSTNSSMNFLKYFLALYFADAME